MNNKVKSLIYAMTGGNGAGKTTYALKIAIEKQALFLSLDKTIKDFNEPIQSYEDYMSFYQQALDLLAAKAQAELRYGGSVVFDFGGGNSSRSWLKQNAEASGAEIVIYHLEVPLEERKKRIQKRNQEKIPEVYFFHLSDDEFDKHNQAEPVPPEESEGIKVVRVRN